MASLVILENSLALTCAYAFLRDCQDEDPVGFGVEQVAALPERRYGVYREASALCLGGGVLRERSVEDELIAMLDGEDDEEEASEPAPESPWQDGVTGDDIEGELVLVHGRLVEVADEPAAPSQPSPESIQSTHPEAFGAVGMHRSHARLHHRARIIRTAA